MLLEQYVHVLFVTNYYVTSWTICITADVPCDKRHRQSLFYTVFQPQFELEAQIFLIMCSFLNYEMG
jgi:hypothetical protein